MSEEGILELTNTAKWLESQGDIDAARDKFREAGEALVREYRRYFVRLAWCTLLPDQKHLVEDIAQDVCLEAYRSLHRFDERRGRLKTWLIGIFWHCRGDTLRRYERQSGPYPKDWETDPNEQKDLTVMPGDRLAEKAIVEQRMNRLRDRDRTILVMHAEGITAREIAAVTDLTPENVRQIIHRSLNFLATGR